MKHLLVYMPESRGGIADYAHDQANALQDLGWEVTCLCVPSFMADRQARYRFLPELCERAPEEYGSMRIVRQLRMARRILENAKRLAQVIERGSYGYVLTHFSEYLSPLWAWRFVRLKKKGVVFGSVLHDPIRDYVVGPRLWHEWSMRQACSFQSVIFVHSEDDIANWTKLRTAHIPQGIYTFPEASEEGEQVRHTLDLPLAAKVLLVAGFIRDSKNLDLLIEAMAKIPNLYLIVAGTVQGGGNKPITYYQDLSRQLRCEDRCRWLISYLDGVARANLFKASDLCILTYSKSFRSASAAMSAAVSYRLPSLVSSGPSSMESVVKRYRLGIWVEPDSTQAIVSGLQHWIDFGVLPDWDNYLNDNSWAVNARRVSEALTT